MKLTIERHADAESFLAATRRWLLEAEADNNLILGVALGRRGRPSDRATSLPYFASAHDRDGIVGCACRTPPQSLIVSRMPLAAVDELAEDVGSAYASLTGVQGPTEEAERFAVAWTRRHGGRPTPKMRLRIHKLTRVLQPRDSRPGSLRRAVQADLKLSREWIDAYIHDTGLAQPSSGVAEQMIGRGRLYLWDEAGTPRCMVATARETDTGCAIHTVYTPPRYRRQGYATAAVAALSDALLKAGRAFCCLYTDTANPTSNSIYAKIGYEPIRDELHIEFDA